MKTCFKCEEEKPLSEFYVHKHMGDGHLNKCKACTKIDTQLRYQQKMQDPHWVDSERERQRIKERNKRSTAQMRHFNKLMHAALWRRKNPKKFKAQYCVGNAVRSGSLTRQPCEVCGHSKAQAHHDDYNQPLKVRWLCVTHHAKHHVNERRKLLFQGVN